MRSTVSFNSHWVDGCPCWDILLINGDIIRSVSAKEIARASDRHVDVVRECDIQAYGAKQMAELKKDKS